MSVSYSGRRTRGVPGGFTLLEVLLVLVILVTLAGLAVGTYDGIRRGANIKAARTQIGLFESQLALYQMALTTYPGTDQGLEALRNPPTDLVNPDSWEGPYLDKPVPLDPWGNPYQYLCPGKSNPDKYDLWSFGPDLTDGTADDIGNWTQE
jgi:general secretion pathway protein G